MIMQIITTNHFTKFYDDRRELEKTDHSHHLTDRTAGVAWTQNSVFFFVQQPLFK